MRSLFADLSTSGEEALPDESAASVGDALPAEALMEELSTDVDNRVDGAKVLQITAI